MELARSKPIYALLAGALLGLIVMPIAFAGATDGPDASASASVKKTVKKLKKRVAALENEQAPNSLPPNGPAGGDLTGEYPDPLIGPAAVGSDEIADGAVATAKIADGAVDSAKIADDAVGAADIAAGGVGSSEILNGSVNATDLGDGIVARAADVAVPGGGTAENGSYDSDDATASCLAGEEVISGGAFWVTGAADDQELWISELQVFHGTEQVFGRGGNDSGTAETLQVQAYCLL